MREARTEALIRLPDDFTTSQLLIDRLARGGGGPLYSVRRGGTWTDVSTARFTADVRSLAAALLGAGVRPGAAVVIMARTSYEWALAEQAIWFAGAVSVPVYETSSAHQVEWILRDSGARHAFVEDAVHAALVRRAAEALDAAVEVWEFGDDGSGAIPAAGLRSLAASGAARTDVGAADVEAARTSRRLGDAASIVYTSGTTGRPKGCTMTHGNFSEVAVNLVPHMREVVGPDSRTLMFLPLAHVLARAVQQCCVHAGTTVAHAPSAATLQEDLAAFRPTFLLAVPRVFEKLRAGALAKAEARGKERLFRAAERTAADVSRRRDARARGRRLRPDPVLAARHAFFSAVLYPRLRAALGGRAAYAISGASPLDPGLAHFFRGAGLCLLEGYGLTETTAPATVNAPALARVGSVGFPVPGTEIRIADDGEVLVRGIGVFAGYHRNPEATAEAFDADGFFRTGDLGRLDDDGFLSITGRKKDLIVTAGGKNVSPGPLEEALRTCRIVSEAVVVGDNRPYVAALLTLDPDALGAWARARGLGDLGPAAAATHPAVLAELQGAVDAANATVSRAEGIRRFAVLEADFTEESGHLTPSLKLKRQSVLDSFAGRIGDLYA